MRSVTPPPTGPRATPDGPHPVAAPTRLSRAVVLREAIALLDDEGLDALTMRRLAERLGVVPMAIYRHVANKDDLLEGVLDLAVSTVAIPAADLGWRDGLRTLAHNIRAAVLAHPGVVAPLVTRPSLGPHSLVIGEYSVGRLVQAGFAPDDAGRGSAAVLTYTLGFVALEVPRRQLGWDPRGVERTAIDVAPGALEPEEFPHTSAAPPMAAALVSDAQFDYGLERLLDGIGQSARRQRPARRRR